MSLPAAPDEGEEEHGGCGHEGGDEPADPGECSDESARYIGIEAFFSDAQEDGRLVLGLGGVAVGVAPVE